MMSERVNNIRVGINLIVFGIIAALVTWWAITTLVRLDIIERPQTVTVDFPHSTGLQKEFEVTYLGLRVGRISEVELVPGKVRVELKLDRDHKVPANVVADVQRKSAIGEPIVALDPPPKGDISTELLKDGDHIALNRTSATPHYTELFKAMTDLLSAVDSDSVATIVRELAIGWKGRGEEVRQAITDVGYTTHQLAENGPLLDELSANVTRLTHTLAGKRDQIDRSVKQMRLIGREMVKSRKNFEKVLSGGVDMGQRLSKLVTETAPDWGCAVDASANALGELRGLYPPLNDLFQHWYPLLHEAFNDIVEVEPDGPWAQITGGVKFVTDKPGPRVYTEPLRLPDPPQITDCAQPNKQVSGAGQKRVKQSEQELLPNLSGGRPAAPKLPGKAPELDGKAQVSATDDVLLMVLLVVGTLLLSTLVAGAMARQELQRRRSS